MYKQGLSNKATTNYTGLFVGAVVEIKKLFHLFIEELKYGMWGGDYIG